MKRLVIWISSCLVGVPLCWGALQVVATPVLNADGLETAFTLTVEAEEGRYLALAWDESDRGDSSQGWAHWSLWGEVAAGISTHTVAVPTGVSRLRVSMSNFFHV